MQYSTVFLLASFLFSLSIIYSVISLYSESRAPFMVEKAIRIAARTRIIENPKNIGKNVHAADPLLSPSNLTNNSIKFYKITDSNYALFAMTDDRRGNMDHPCVRILMAIQFATPFSCKFGEHHHVEGKLYEFAENHSKPKKSFYLNCKLPSTLKLEDINAVTIVDEAAQREVTVPITYRIQQEAKYKNFVNKMTICIPFVFGTKYTGKSFVEFVELNRLLGYDKITLYMDATNMPSDVLKTINYYEKEGILDPVQFKLPFPESSIWYHGQLLVVTDCLNRNTGKSELVAFHDLDEFMIPQKGKSLLEVVREELKGEMMGSLRVSVYDFKPSEKLPMTLESSLRSSRKEERFTKCIVRPHFVFEQGIHHTSRVIQDHFKMKENDNALIMLHHYKNNSIDLQQMVKDDRIYTIYSNDLLTAYKEKVEQIGL